MGEESSKNLTDGASPDRKTAINPAAITPAQLAQAIGVPEQQISRYIAEGAPTSDGSGGGTINLVHFAAWLNRRLKERDA